MRILVIDDEHKTALAIKKVLEQEAYAADIAYDGNEGLDLASSEKYDVIILDRLLPGIDGIDVCHKLRQEKIATPILMLTAKRQMHEKVEGLDAGADDYLAKPFAFEELLARIRSLIRRRKTPDALVLSVEDLTLNTITFEVKRADKSINLSKKEFALLEYLMRHADTIVSKDQITQHIWNYDADILPVTIESYISYLRTKIDRPFSSSLIHTIKGFGYKIGKK